MKNAFRVALCSHFARPPALVPRARNQLGKRLQQHYTAQRKSVIAPWETAAAPIRPSKAIRRDVATTTKVPEQLIKRANDKKTTRGTTTRERGARYTLVKHRRERSS